MRNKLVRRTGFTLVELLVVIAMIAMVMAVFFPNFLGARQRARDTRRKSDLSQIQKALELYKLDQIPPAYPTGPFDPGACNVCWSSDGFMPSDSCTGNVYMKEFPCDPGSVDPQPYIYSRHASDTLRYILTACLENGADQDRDAEANAECSTSTSYTITEQ